MKAFIFKTKCCNTDSFHEKKSDFCVSCNREVSKERALALSEYFNEPKVTFNKKNRSNEEKLLTFLFNSPPIKVA